MKLSPSILDSYERGVENTSSTLLRPADSLAAKNVPFIDQAHLRHSVDLRTGHSSGAGSFLWNWRGALVGHRERDAALAVSLVSHFPNDFYPQVILPILRLSDSTTAKISRVAKSLFFGIILK